MSEEIKKRLPPLPFELPDPLEMLSEVESVIGEADVALTEFEKKASSLDQKISGMDKKFVLSKKSAPTTSKGIADLMRTQFKFSCPVCEEIAEKVSRNLPGSEKKTMVYEAVYKLTSKDKTAKDEAVTVLEDLGVLKEVSKEIKLKWEKLKG